MLPLITDSIDEAAVDPAAAVTTDSAVTGAAVTPEWLRDLEANSWNMELFISGGAIFSLIQANDWLLSAVESFKITTALVGTDFLFITLILALQLLTLGFGLHLLLRAAWVGLVCVNYLYPDGAQPARVAWRWPFRARAPAVGMEAGILRLNQLCAGVMFLALTAAALLGGVMLLLVVVLVLPSLTNITQMPVWGYYTASVLLLLVLYLVDLALFGALRRVPGLAVMLFPAFWLYDRLSLRTLYQPALWLFATNVPRRRVGAGLALVSILALVASFEVLQRSYHWYNPFDRRAYRERLAPGPAIYAGFYLDELAGQAPGGVAIPSKLVDKPFVEVFIVYRAMDDQILRANRARHVSDILLLSVDDSVYAAQTWYPTYKSLSSRIGLTAMVPIRHLPDGPHTLRVASRYDKSRYAIIPFWKATN